MKALHKKVLIAAAAGVVAVIVYNKLKPKPTAGKTNFTGMSNATGSVPMGAPVGVPAGAPMGVPVAPPAGVGGVLVPPPYGGVGVGGGVPVYRG